MTTDAEILKKFRARFSLTQQQAAEILGLKTGRSIGRIENREVGPSGPARLSDTTRRAMEYYTAWQEATGRMTRNQDP